MRKIKVTSVLVSLLFIVVFAGAVSGPIQAAETVSVNGIMEDGENPDMQEYPLASELDLWSLDWREAENEKINHYLGMTEWNVIGMWLSSMSKEELEELLSRDTVLIQETQIERPDAEPVQMLYYEYALQVHKAMSMSRAAYPEKTSGYWKTNIVQVNASGTPVRSAVITCKVSGIDTSVPTGERQEVTVAKSITGNWCDVAWGEGEEHIKSYRTQSVTTYPYVRTYFNFVKPAGYKVNVSYSLSSSLYKLYWNKATTFQGESMFGKDGVISPERFVYPESATHNGVSTAPLLESQYEGRHKVCAIVNMYINAGIGTTANPTNGNLIQTITLIPIGYNVSYDGNGATSGTVSVQNCTYDVNYIAQQNGFQREYHISYDGNGGNAAVTSQKATYTFKGWGLNQKNTVTHRAGATYKNLTAVDGGAVTMYALWEPASVKLPTATRKGYVFNGWNIGEGGAAYTPTANVTAIAAWTPITYRIRFQSGGGSNCEDILAKYDQNVTLPVPVKPGYTFAGWKGTAGTHIGTVRNLTDEKDGVVTLVAEWTPMTDTAYTVRCYKQPSADVTDKSRYVLFDLDSGDSVDGEYLQYGTTDETVTVAPQKIEGYVTPPAQSIQIAGDGSSVVNFYYDLEIVPADPPSFSFYDEQLDEIAKKIAAGLSFSLDVDGVEYEIEQRDDGTLGIKFISTDAEKIVIPDVVTIGEKVYRITEIQSGVFQGNVRVKEVQLSANISKIGSSAFEGCTSLSKIEMREGLVTIGKKAFRGCSSLKRVKLPATVQSIGTQAFENCTKMTGCTLNEGLLKIGKKAFRGCKALTKITVPKSVLEIGSYAFSGCNKLKTVTFVSGSRLLSAGEGVFSKCIMLQKIKLPSKLTAVSTKSFYGCKKLKSVTGGSGVTKIGTSAFEGCVKLTKITIPGKVQTIGKKAFYNCKQLKKVTIKSKALTSVGSKAFKKCKKGIIFVVPKNKKNEYSKLFKGKY